METRIQYEYNKTLEHNYTLTQSCREIKTFNEISEPHILLDRCVRQRARSTYVPFALRTM
jgi:hypothetical protein